MTCTGTHKALPTEAFEHLKDGCLLANAGAVDDEFDMNELRAGAIATREVRPHVVEFRLGLERSVFVIGGGKVVNLSAGDGHAIEIMDLTFSVQALAARYLLVHWLLPPEVDEWIARAKLDALGLRIDRPARGYPLL